jgi:Tfp pilus assembly protein PilV
MAKTLNICEVGYPMKQRGTSLIEALVATVVMAFGMMAVSGIQTRLRYTGDFTKQRSEATQFAQGEIEQLRSYVASSRGGSAIVPAGALVFDEIANRTRSLEGSSTTYTLTRTVSSLDASGANITINVSWQDRKSEDNQTNQLEWRTTLANIDPHLTAAAYAPPAFGVSQRRALDRHNGIPVGAKSISPNQSAFKPIPNGTVALIFNNLSGMVTDICTVASGATSDTLTKADFASCNGSITGGAYLLSGHIRYSLGATPDPLNANDAVLPTSVAVDVTTIPVSNISCYSDSEANAKAGISAVDYYCVVPPRIPTQSDPNYYWSGSTSIGGFLIGAGGYRVCRYSDDYNRNSIIENGENPLLYSKVSESLARQNFLVVRYASACPAGQAIDPPNQIYVNTVTKPHQPAS